MFLSRSCSFEPQACDAGAEEESQILVSGKLTSWSDARDLSAYFLRPGSVSGGPQPTLPVAGHSACGADLRSFFSEHASPISLCPGL